jgi:hypothetical protein
MNSVSSPKRSVTLDADELPRRDRPRPATFPASHDVTTTWEDGRVSSWARSRLIVMIHRLTAKFDSLHPFRRKARRSGLVLPMEHPSPGRKLMESWWWCHAIGMIVFGLVVPTTW